MTGACVNLIRHVFQKTLGERLNACLFVIVDFLDIFFHPYPFRNDMITTRDPNGPDPSAGTFFAGPVAGNPFPPLYHFIVPAANRFTHNHWRGSGSLDIDRSLHIDFALDDHILPPAGTARIQA